jgi:hypothetical protein
VDGLDATDTGATRPLGRVAVIAGVTLVISRVVAVGMYVGVLVILSPMMG